MFQAKKATAEEATPTYSSGQTVPAVGRKPPWTARLTPWAGSSRTVPTRNVVNRNPAPSSPSGLRRSSALYDPKQQAAAIIHRSPAEKDAPSPPTSSRTPAQATASPAIRRAPSRTPPARSYRAMSTGDAAMIMPMLAAGVVTPAWLTRVL